jgi:hypothetical protein
MPVSFDTSSVTNETNVAPENDNDENKRKFHARPTPHPKKKLRSIDEDDDSDTTTQPNHLGGDPSSRTILFGGNASDGAEETIEKKKVTKQMTDTVHAVVAPLHERIESMTHSSFLVYTTPSTGRRRTGRHCYQPYGRCHDASSRQQ